MVIRRNTFHSSTRTQGYMPQMGNCNQGYLNENGLWVCAFPPPSYENIQESSFPINSPPDYDSTAVKIIKMNKGKEMKLNQNDSNQLPDNVMNTHEHMATIEETNIQNMILSPTNLIKSD
jgi:hypothetical protein